MEMNPKINRRQLIKTIGASGGLAFSYEVRSETERLASFKINPWVVIDADNTSEITVERSSMGQGAIDGIVSVICEEADIDPSLVRWRQAEPNRVYDNRDYGVQVTGGSTSLSQGYKAWRELAAKIRRLMQVSAAEIWKVDADKCKTRDSFVIHPNQSTKLSYGELITAAHRQEISGFSLKAKSEFKIIGKDRPRIDADLKAKGKAHFGCDIAMKDQKFAVVVHSPYVKGKLVKIKNAKDFNDQVYSIFKISSGVAVIADSYWQAYQISQKLEIEWKDLSQKDHSRESLEKEYLSSLNQAKHTLRDQGDVESDFATQTKIIESDYFFPYAAHKTMEPMNTICRFESGHCYIRTPTQAPAIAMEKVRQQTGLPENKIHFEITHIGGGFGRRLNVDIILEAVEIAYQSKNPIQLLWSREEDMKNDFYRPLAVHRFRASLNNEGQPTSWHHRFAAQPILPEVVSDWAPAIMPKWIPDFMKNWGGSMASSLSRSFATNDTNTEGAKEISYNIPNIKVEFNPQQNDMPVGFWRSVGHSHNGPAIECFMDELAEAADKDPIQYRLKLLQSSPRTKATLELLEKMLPSERSMLGIAQHFCFGSDMAVAVDIEKLESGKFRLKKVYATADCGFLVNPDIVRSQIESGIIYALSSTLYDDVPIQNNRIALDNFHNSPVLRQSESPDIEIDMVESDQDPSGVGEISVPATVAALINALSRHKGERLRKLPVGEYFA